MDYEYNWQPMTFEERLRLAFEHYAKRWLTENMTRTHAEAWFRIGWTAHAEETQAFLRISRELRERLRVWSQHE